MILRDGPSGLGTWDWELKSNTMCVDGALAGLYGVEPGLPVDASIRSTYIPRIQIDDRDEHIRRLANATQLGGLFTTEYRVLDLSGRSRQIVARGATRFDDHGTAVGFFGIMADVSTDGLTRAATSVREKIADDLALTRSLIATVNDPVLAQIIDMALLHLKSGARLLN